MGERPIEHCPFCNTDLIIEYQEKNEVKYGSKKIGIYDRELDMVTHTSNVLFVMECGRENKEMEELVMFNEKRKRCSKTKNEFFDD